MKNRLLTWVTLIVLLLFLSACKPTEPELVATETATVETQQQNPTQDTNVEQAYPLEVAEKPTVQAESAYPITQNDLGHLAQVWSLTEAYIDGAATSSEEKTIKFNSDNTYQITTFESTIAGTWTARLLATESNLVLSSSNGTMFSYQIQELTADLLVLTSNQDGKILEEHFTPVNW